MICLYRLPRHGRGRRIGLNEVQVGCGPNRSSTPCAVWSARTGRAHAAGRRDARIRTGTGRRLSLTSWPNRSGPARALAGWDMLKLPAQRDTASRRDLLESIMDPARWSCRASLPGGAANPSGAAHVVIISANAEGGPHVTRGPCQAAPARAAQRPRRRNQISSGNVSSGGIAATATSVAQNGQFNARRKTGHAQISQKRESCSRPNSQTPGRWCRCRT